MNFAWIIVVFSKITHDIIIIKENNEKKSLKYKLT